ncbi:MAG: thioredoxin domain-containing protein [Bacteroidia bacterium]|nr:thioredoxin domain-containing protein [Bacteroidia bacterium]NND09820.1 thioredoxin domain-containing protein [Flavobacteriaceae bacterium]MBT8309132.1 thioredoxin domain-containing protein [Bacteroidia bacterium]NNK27144.1 thioredoxin domain-containing protein [Flavobacteriaceae bacterium]NNL60929.1 thioredoxin domain-containing protein [Flavobacteriaceae bacterium]
MAHKYTNDLINETSPYLLQHAHNPVNWKAWNDQTLSEAKESNKLILISVGYAACHWCHVMEHESFEDSLVAQVMNDNFINIKVDREERPDVDQVYMNAVQLMTGSGGWPLNVIALPDGRPVWGGTYFKKNDWMNVLNQISDIYNKTPEQLLDYASKLEEGIKSMDLVTLNTDAFNFKKPLINEAIEKWSKLFDSKKGGLNRAPKFMMPNNYHFLMRQAHQNNNPALMEFVNTTLEKMAYGGIYDQIGGGFSRYSVDDKWHVPHFEKMLYDNAQLVSLYSDAYLLTKKDIYKEVVYETLQFVERELTNDEGIFYSSLDADSLDENQELEEGAYYVWQKEELKSLLGEDYDLFSDYYNINNYGLWEKGNYVLIRSDSDNEIAEKHDLSVESLDQKISSWKELLLKTREQRSRPRLDDKSLTSWNALMIKGYLDAYRVFNEESFLDSAKKNAEFILNTQHKDDGGLWHSYKDGKSTINGYLEDYAGVIDAFISMYENTFDDKWLKNARNLSNYAFDHFYEDANKMFYFTSDEDPSLVTRNIDYRDNVIPSSNSIMAKNLFKLSHYFDNESYANTSKTMLNNVLPELKEYPTSFSNWLDLMLNFTNNYYEVAISGKEAYEKTKELNQFYIPNKLLAVSNEESDMPLLLNRYLDEETMIYVCVNKACKLPVSEVDKAIDLIEK